ncbi:MAG: iron-sulfur cluster assembly accessory protein [Sulfuriflexus sp.]|nr:iron-sulfur cluster assembly accessory protein [Sulfuriflexus sp.]
MLKITDTALTQIKKSISEETKGMSLRIAAKQADDGSIQYGMGYDDNKAEDDVVVELEGLEVLIAPSSRDLLIGATIDYVSLEDEEMHFIFINPNDPNHKAPQDN